MNSNKCTEIKFQSNSYCYYIIICFFLKTTSNSWEMHLETYAQQLVFWQIDINDLGYLIA